MNALNKHGRILLLASIWVGCLDVDGDERLSTAAPAPAKSAPGDGAGFAPGTPPAHARCGNDLLAPSGLAIEQPEVADPAARVGAESKAALKDVEPLLDHVPSNVRPEIVAAQEDYILVKQKLLAAYEGDRAAYEVARAEEKREIMAKVGVGVAP